MIEIKPQITQLIIVIPILPEPLATPFGDMKIPEPEIDR
jgi:hypothetical protein